ncbi:MAG TPA: NADH-quinone oxidoreductase subunit NuoG [Nitrospirales bacterium]|nr:NADH-quinone oxidoreductase subunit NuoG [Nitrospirales bacterium]
MSDEQIKVTIDQHTITVPKGTLVIEAARQAGVMIPHFCYHPKLKPDANCRMCLVEIEKVPKLQTSCSTPVAPGMVVRTATTVVNEAHKSVLEFILANHPLDCPVCDQGGRCDLQDFSHEYTPTTSRFIEVKRVFDKGYFNPLIEKQMNRCVQCLRCVRYCDEVIDSNALAPVGRGVMTEISHFGSHALDCDYCGGCIQICPVGAITSRLSMYEFRPWMLKRADTICTYCGDGCAITIQSKNNELVEVMSAHGAGRNNGDLCARGYFGYHASTHPQRISTPLIRRNGELALATWDEALEYLAERVLRLKLDHGAGAFAGLIGGRCTNEDLYVFQKFMRLAIGTAKIDSSARYGQVNALHALRRVQGTHRWSVTFEDIVAADVLLTVGTNLTETNPITGLKVKEAVKKRGATLVTIESLLPSVGTLSNIVNLSRHPLAVLPDAMPAAVLAIIKAVIENNLIDGTLPQKASGYLEALRQAVGRLPWTELERRTGLKQDEIVPAARALAAAKRVVIVAGPGVIRRPGGAGTLTNLLDLLLLTGHHGRPGCGLAPLAEENNDQGTVEMGAVAEYLPGPSEVGDRAMREKLASVWKDNVPDGNGGTLTDILAEARAGTVKAMFVIGENPVGTLPKASGAREALERLELLVCQELFLTDTAAVAHVVLPACSYAEKDGSFTNTEGHVQALHRAIDPIGESRPDWEILSALSVLMGYPIEYGDAKEIFKEIRGVIPGYQLLGAAPMPPRPDERAVARYLSDGYAGDLAQRYALGPVGADDGMLQLVLAQSLFHSGKLSTMAKGLLQIEPQGRLSISPDDANRLSLQDGDRVTVSNERGQFTTTVRVWERVPPGLVTFPEHFEEAARQLISMAVDPETKAVYVREARVRLQKAS